MQTLNDALDDEGHLRIVDGVYEPGTTATLAETGSCKTFAEAEHDAWVIIDLLDVQDVETVYIMGSLHSDTQDDLTGIDMFVMSYTTGSNDIWRCPDIIDGSGFYHCGGRGKFLKLTKYEESTSFTICEIRVYTHTNYMALNPIASTNQPYPGFPISNVVRTHPVSFSQYGSHAYSTAISGPSPSYMDFTFDKNWKFKKIVIEGSQDEDGSNASGGINYYVKVLDQNGSLVGECNEGAMITEGPHAEVDCGSSGFTGRIVRLQKDVSELLIIHAIAMLGHPNESCSSGCNIITIIPPKGPDLNTLLVKKWYGREDSQMTHKQPLIHGFCLNRLGSCSYTTSLIMNDGTLLEDVDAG